jgi:hypothetical protein
MLATALILVALPAVARADQIQTFDLTGTFFQAANPAITGNFSATITIDTTTGLISSVFLTDPYGTFGGACFLQCAPPGIGDGHGGNLLEPLLAGGLSFDLGILQGSLVGITTLTLDPAAVGASSGFVDSFLDTSPTDPACGGVTCEFQTATITPAPVSEPATLWLLGTGIGLVLVMRKRIA